MLNNDSYSVERDKVQQTPFCIQLDNHGVRELFFSILFALDWRMDIFPTI